jgi:hypothetical protein
MLPVPPSMCMWAYWCEAEVRASAAQVEWMVAVAARMHALGWAEYDTLVQVKKKKEPYSGL